jgi:hypothetical protein
MQGLHYKYVNNDLETPLYIMITRKYYHTIS